MMYEKRVGMIDIVVIVELEFSIIFVLFYKIKRPIKQLTKSKLRHMPAAIKAKPYSKAYISLSGWCIGMHQSGKWYTDNKIDQLPMERYMAQKAKHAKVKHHLKKLSKRMAEDDRHFEESFRQLVKRQLEAEQSGGTEVYV